MKILRLTLRNLASLAGTHTVDFEREPLRSTGLFAISGPTGSGKSTLLDALCLALYEDTPRLRSASGTKLPDVGANEITQKDPANLLRRGEVEGFAEVAFVGVDAQTYTARWSVRRARQRQDGALQNAEMVLLRGNIRGEDTAAIECGGKKSEVLEAIAAKVGLSFPQFTRAVLLAQNDFAVFLKSDDRERAEILQALTGTERFERISIRVFEREREERAAIAALEANALGQAPLAPELRATAEAELQRTTAAANAAKQKLFGLEAASAWFARQRELAAQLATARVNLEQALTAREQALPRRLELQEAEDILREARSPYDAERSAEEQHASAVRALGAGAEEVARRDRASLTTRRLHDEANATDAKAQQAMAAAAEPLQQARMLDARLAPLFLRRTEKRREREAAEHVLEQHGERARRIDPELGERQKRQAAALSRRQSVAWVAPALEEAPAWIERLQAVLQRRAEAVRVAKALQAAIEAEAKVRDELELVRTKLAEQRRVQEQKAAERAAAELELKQFDPETLAAERARLEARFGALNGVRQELTRTTELARAVAAAVTTVRQLEAEADKQAQLLVSRRQYLQQAWTRFEQARGCRDLAEKTVAEHTLRLREALRPDEPCPVCGAMDHPYAAHAPVVDATLQALRDQEYAAEKHVLEVRDEIARLEASITGLREQEAARVVEGDRLQAELTAARERLNDALARAELGDVIETERVAAVAGAIRQVEIARVVLGESEKRQRAAAKKYAEAVKACEVTQVSLSAAEKMCAAGESALVKAVAEKHAAGESSARTERELADAERGIAALFALLGSSVEQQFRTSAAGFGSRFTDAVKELRALEEQLAALHAELGKLSVERDEVMKAVTVAGEAVQARRTDEATASEDYAQVAAARAQLFGGRPTDAVEREITDAVKLARTRLEDVARQVAADENALVAARTALTTAQTAVAELEVRKNQATRALDGWIADYATKSGRDLDRSRIKLVLARTPESFEQERATLDVLQQAVTTAEGEVAVHLRNIDQHATQKGMQDDEATVLAALASWKAAVASAEEQRLQAAAVILADDQRRKEHVLLEGQLALQRKRAEPWAKLNELIGSADGAKFRAIVQGRTLDLLLDYANAQLELLAPRYRVDRLRPSLNLIVIDRDMADERRSVHSLSGGESFLVSLALALALASLTSNRIRIESLFIDEGFGSLDQATLTTAMNALMHLEAQGRKVGVISHVTEMADAIPVQIKVVKGPAGTSRIVVPGQPQLEDDGPSLVDHQEGEAAAMNVAGKLLAILQRQKELGQAAVSIVSLRKQLGCALEELTAAREALGDQIVAQGRSLALR